MARARERRQRWPVESSWMRRSRIVASARPQDARRERVGGSGALRASMTRGDGARVARRDGSAMMTAWFLARSWCLRCLRMVDLPAPLGPVKRAIWPGQRRWSIRLAVDSALGTVLRSGAAERPNMARARRWRVVSMGGLYV